jgi:putative redox protein
MAKISITHLTEDQFHIAIRGHELTVDQPRHGEESGPSPTELFVASMAACVGHYAARFLRENQLAYQGLRVECEWKMLAGEQARISRVRMEVAAPQSVPGDLRDGLQRAMERCTVHNALHQPPQVIISLAEDPGDVPAEARPGRIELAG